MTSTQRYLLSSLTTFVSVFLITLGLQFEVGNVVLDKAFFFTAVMVAGRAGAKAVIETVVGAHADK